MLETAISWLLEEAGLERLPWGVLPYRPELVRPELPCRRASLIPKEAAALAIFAFPYKVEAAFGGNLSCYAAVADYHRVWLLPSPDALRPPHRALGGRLSPLCGRLPL